MIRGASKRCSQSFWKTSLTTTATPQRGFASSKPEQPSESPPKDQSRKDGDPATPVAPEEPKTNGSRRKTMAELDEEMKLKMSGLAGDGGEAGIEYEDGQPVAMKRSVKNNMFRYI